MASAQDGQNGLSIQQKNGIRRFKNCRIIKAMFTRISHTPYILVAVIGYASLKAPLWVLGGAAVLYTIAIILTYLEKKK